MCIPSMYIGVRYVFYSTRKFCIYSWGITQQALKGSFLYFHVFIQNSERIHTFFNIIVSLSHLGRFFFCLMVILPSITQGYTGINIRMCMTIILNIPSSFSGLNIFKMKTSRDRDRLTILYFLYIPTT